MGVLDLRSNIDLRSIIRHRIILVWQFLFNKFNIEIVVHHLGPFTIPQPVPSIPKELIFTVGVILGAGYD
jgi:hypothetical protein